MFCYVNVHPHLGSYISLPWYVVLTWSLGVRGMANLQDGPGQCQRVGSPWEEEAPGESVPSLSDSSRRPYQSL